MQSLTARAGIALGDQPRAGRKSGAEPARNGHSFLAIVQRAIAGAKEGKANVKATVAGTPAGRGEGDAHIHSPKKAARQQAAQPRAIPKRDGAGEGDLAAGYAASFIPIPPQAEAVPAKAANGMVSRESTTRSVDSRKKDGRREDSGVDVRASVGRDGVVAAQSRERTAEAGQAERSARRDRKPLISVRDERDAATKDAAQAVPGRDSAIRIAPDGGAEMSIGFRGAEGGESPARADAPREAEGRASFASMLRDEIQSNAADFVRAGSIVLRENDVGTIRLNLHPESLGNVKISLELADRKISGKIVVSSQEAYEAFNESLDGLAKAFVEGGFESAGFDLSFAGDGMGGRESEAGKASSPFYASAIPDVMPTPERADSVRAGYPQAGFSAVNMLA